jgi:hypothetical protein
MQTNDTRAIAFIKMTSHGIAQVGAELFYGVTMSVNGMMNRLSGESSFIGLFYQKYNFTILHEWIVAQFQGQIKEVILAG